MKAQNVPQGKALVDKIVDQMECITAVSECHEKWLVLQGKVDAYYDGKPREHIPLSQQKEFRAIKNDVIKEAENMWKCKLFFEDRGIEAESEPEDLDGVTYDYWNIRSDIYKEDFTLEERLDAVKEMEQLANGGDMYAQYLMGKLWRDGPLLTPDSVNTRYWFVQAAQRGAGNLQKARYVRQPPAVSDLPQVRCRAVPVRGRAS